MQTILVAGAGKTSIYLIDYLIEHAASNDWKIIVADGNAEAVAAKTRNSKYTEAAVIDITEAEQRQPLVKKADVVISLMPPHLHISLAKDCLLYNKHIITASYVSDEMKELDAAAKAKGLMFMCEMGLDPGIDHMTASQIFHSIHKVAATITSFKSYAGGLIAPESDDNPWHYKFTWNPRNIITAGMAGAQYLHNKTVTTLPYNKVFTDVNAIESINGIEDLISYPNRDSLKYLDIYEVPRIDTFIRGSLRHPIFCKGWQALIDLGLTDITDEIEDGIILSKWIANKINFEGVGDLTEFVAAKFNLDNEVTDLISWLGLFEDTAVSFKGSSSGDLLMHILLEKWEMQPNDKDMIVMQHEVEYIHKSKTNKLVSTLVIKGENREYSAMAKTVGLPMGILAKQLLTGKIKAIPGVQIPTMPAVYKPVLAELEQYGIEFKETVI